MKVDRAFSQLIEDSQFSPIGLVLLAAIASLDQLFSESVASSTQPKSELGLSDIVLGDADEDLGEVIARRALMPKCSSEKMSNIFASPATHFKAKGDELETPQKPGTGRHKHQKSKMKEKKSVIDDIFKVIA